MPQSGSWRLLWRGQGRRGCKKHPRDPPHTHPVSTTDSGGKSGRIGQTARRSRFSAGFGGIWGREVPACHVRGGPRAPPASRRPKPAGSAPNLPPLPPPLPARVPGGGSGWGRGAPGTCHRRFGGVLPQIRGSRPLLAPTLTRFGDKSLNLSIPAAGFGEKT